MNLFINTDAADNSRARTVGLNNLLPLPFPVLTVGTQPTLNWFFAASGTLESWSGSGSYGLRVTVADSFIGPRRGTWSLQVGGNTALTLPWDLDAGGIQNQLNLDATVIAEGGMDVLEHGNGQFIIANRAAGVVTGLTVDGALLVPDCTATLSVLTTGAAGVRQLTSLSLRRTTPLQSTTWTTISSPYAGWTGTLHVDTPALFQLLQLNGVRKGQYLDLETFLTAEVLDSSSNVVATYQTPITLRALNYDSTAQTGTLQTILQNFFSRPNVVGLASNTANSTLLGGLATSSGQFPVGSVISLDFSNDVVGRWVRKASTANQSVPWVVRPYDYDAGNNAYQWIIDRVTKQGQPTIYDADSNKWHYIVAVGNANAVSMAVDQTGFSLPA